MAPPHGRFGPPDLTAGGPRPTPGLLLGVAQSEIAAGVSPSADLSVAHGDVQKLSRRHLPRIEPVALHLVARSVRFILKVSLRPYTKRVELQAEKVRLA